MTHEVRTPVKSSTLSMLEEGYVDIENILDDIEDPEDYEFLKNQLMKRVKEKPHSANLFELLGVVLLELGILEEAEKNFVKSIELNSKEGYYKYLHLAQLYGNKKGLEFTEKAIELMKNIQEKQLEKETELSTNLTRKIISAYCFIAELYMTDLCDEKNAESLCEEAISNALKLNSEDLETKLTLINLRLCQSQVDEAENLFNQLISPWYRESNDEDESEQNEESDNIKGEIEEKEAEEQEKHSQRIFSIDNTNLPPYSQRISIVKLCIELQLYEEALDFLQTLLAEDDEDAHNWYLCGWTYYLMQDMITAREYLTKAFELANQSNSEDEDMLLHIQELLVNLDSEEKYVNLKE